VPQIWQGLPPDWHALTDVPGWHVPLVSQQPLHVDAHEAPPPSSPLLPLLLLVLDDESSPLSSPGGVESSPDEPEPDDEVLTSSPLPDDEPPYPLLEPPPLEEAAPLELPASSAPPDDPPLEPVATLASPRKPVSAVASWPAAQAESRTRQGIATWTGRKLMKTPRGAPVPRPPQDTEVAPRSNVRKDMRGLQGALFAGGVAGRPGSARDSDGHTQTRVFAGSVDGSPVAPCPPP
jgi:hypothetical protein